MFLTIEIDIEFCLKVIHFLGEITLVTRENTRKWKGQLQKREVGKFAPKLESSRQSWKVRAEVGK